MRRLIGVSALTMILAVFGTANASESGNDQIDVYWTLGMDNLSVPTERISQSVEPRESVDDDVYWHLGLQDPSTLSPIQEIGTSSVGRASTSPIDRNPFVGGR